MDKIDIYISRIWYLKHFDNNTFEPSQCFEQSFDFKRWYKTNGVPDVYLVLLKKGVISDPFFGMNTDKCKWIEEKDWCFVTEFTCSNPETIESLLFEGLDTFGEIWLNSNKIGESRNMHISYEFKISGILQKKNRLVILFRSPICEAKKYQYKDIYATFNALERMYIRKPAMSYGWDIAPRLVTCGIWRPFYLIPKKKIKLKDVYIRTISIEKNIARISIEFTIENSGEMAALLEVNVYGRCGESEFRVKEKINNGKNIISLKIDNPKLWWTQDFGCPNLYDLKMEVIFHKKIIEIWQDKIGIRVIELIQEPQDGRNISFKFRLNGKDIYMRGINWTPLDAIFARATKGKYEKALRKAKECNINLLRVWGGGIYESDYFYRYCDENGILVFQDFMMACGIYPLDRYFQELLSEEAKAIVKRLRNHPSIALYCGDNENDYARDENWYNIPKERNDLLDPEYNVLTRRVLKTICYELDPSRPYIPSSPYSPTEDIKSNDPSQGDRHFYQLHTEYKNSAFTNEEARFINEQGNLAFPDKKTLRSISNEIWSLDNEIVDHHMGTHRILGCYTTWREWHEAALKRTFGYVPKGLEEYIRLSQLFQACALKYWIERQRIRKFNSGGYILWNLKDCWPQISCAIIDYYFREKLGYYAVKKAFQYVSPIIHEVEKGKFTIYIVNDTLNKQEGKLIVEKINGAKNKDRLLNVKTLIKPNSVCKLDTLFIYMNKFDSDTYIYASFQTSTNIWTNFYFPIDSTNYGLIKELLLI